MKRRIISMALACIMLMLAGCTVTLRTDDNGKNTASNAPSEVQAEEEEGSSEYGGGSPWIDSDLKSNIKKDMDLSPKDDFHLYVNHDWLLKAELPEGRSTESSFRNVDDVTTKKALAVLDDDSLTSHDAELIQSFYGLLIDWDARDKAGVDPIMDTVKDIQGIKSIDDLSEFICDPDTNMQVPIFFIMGNTVAFDDPESYITAVAPGSFTLSDAAEYKDRSEYGDRYYNAYLKLSKDMLKRIGYSEDDAQKMFEAMIDFETRIAEVAMTKADKMAPDYYDKINNIYDPKELKGLSGTFPLEELLKNNGFGKAKRFIIFEPAVIERFNMIYTEDNLEAMKDYLLIKYVINMSELLDSEAYDAYVEADNTITGSTGREKYEKVAYKKVRSCLPTPMDRAFLECYDSTEMKKKITKICEDFIDAYRKMLEEEDWLSDETREKAIGKLDAITINAVYPEKWVDYSDLNLKGLSLVECDKEISKFTYDLNVQNTNGKVDHEIWDFDILEANAYYSQNDNSINIILGILNEPFYSDEMSDEELYGSIGAAIGHEISHAFDTNGAQFDKDGNLLNWWKDEDYEAFQNRADKLIEYYDNITVWEGQNAIGTSLQTEAIADMAGIKAILLMAKEKKDFDYDKFFRGYASLWRRVNTHEYEYLCLTKDEHPLAYLRTNVTLQQFDEFHDTYDIKEGDNMYLAPEDRVSVW